MRATGSVGLGVSDDYAALDAGHYSFYWGYEEPVGGDDEDVVEDWYFVVKFDGVEIFRRAGKEMGVKPADECAESLLTGIGCFLVSRRNALR